MSKENKLSKEVAKRVLDEFKQELASEIRADKFDSYDYKNIKNEAKSTNFSEPSVGMSLGGHVKRMIGEYEREKSTEQSGNYVDNDEIGVQRKK